MVIIGDGKIRDNVLALIEDGDDMFNCSCPTHHITGRCNNQACCCLRHVGGICYGIILLDRCSSCGGAARGEERIVIDCGCVKCIGCAVKSLLEKPWAKELPIEEIMEYFETPNRAARRRIEKLIKKYR